MWKPKKYSCFLKCFFQSRNKIKKIQSVFFLSSPSLLWCLKLAPYFKPEIDLCKQLSSFFNLSFFFFFLGRVNEGVVPSNPPTSSPKTHSEKPLSCNAEWTEKCRNERKDRKNGWEITVRPLLSLFFFQFLPLLSPPTYFSPIPPTLHPSFPPFLSSGVPVEACLRPRQPASSGVGRGGKKRGGGGWELVGKQRSTVAASLGFWGGSTPG